MSKDEWIRDLAYEDSNIPEEVADSDQEEVEDEYPRYTMHMGTPSIVLMKSPNARLLDIYTREILSLNISSVPVRSKSSHGEYVLWRNGYLD
jgi:hypothetical protein